MRAWSGPVLAALGLVGWAWTLRAALGRLEARGRAGLVLADLGVFGSGLLLLPLAGHSLRVEKFLALLALTLALHLALLGGRTGRALRVLARRLDRGAVRPAVLAWLGVAIPLGLVEGLAWCLTEAGVMPYHRGIVTVFGPDTDDDWRAYHVVADLARRPDPILFWRPVPGGPYNRFGLRGPEPVLPRPEATFRVLALGDSNTEGSLEACWPERLQEVLAGRAGRRPEVLNGGVAGYSSFQGLRRLEECLGLEPSLVLFSFGWNDAALTAGPPDSRYRVPPPFLVGVERVLLRFRAYLCLKATARDLSPGSPAPAAPQRPRVGLQEYRDNLAAAVERGRARGVPVVLLTRPHRDPPEALRAGGGFRGRVPDYNDGLRALARERGIPVVDVQAALQAGPPEAFADECHYSTEGARRAATFLAMRLRELGLVP
ncbi:MAG: hypothetical protein HY722_05340 [Planctomycetes bacterium]|nr:hypothetical protein [Planctomycetota bacterium]